MRSGAINVDASGRAVVSIATLPAGTHNITATYNGDTDDATRIMLVRGLLHGQGWWDQHLMRLQPPVGVYMHWSRLLDGGIALMERVFALVVDWPRADWLTRLKTHLSRFDMVGLAGTTRLAYPMWVQSGPPYIFGQVAHTSGTKDWPAPYRLEIYGAPAGAIYGIQAMDGLFLAMRREVLARVTFDEKTFDGFHCYDLDFTFCAYLAGFKLAVICDMPALHDSTGNFSSDAWRQTAQLFTRKHGHHFPPMSSRKFMVAQVSAQSKEELLEIMSPPYIRPAK